MTKPINIEWLKRQARKLHKENPDLNHTECLEVLARKFGFKTYAALLAAQKETT